MLQWELKVHALDVFVHLEAFPPRGLSCFQDCKREEGNSAFDLPFVVNLGSVLLRIIVKENKVR